MNDTIRQLLALPNWLVLLCSGSCLAFPWLGMSIALGLVGAHFWLATDRTTQLKLVLTAAGVGLVIDSTQLWMGVFAFPSGVVVDWLPPPWMSVLWVQFATTFHYSMRWLSGRYSAVRLLRVRGSATGFFRGGETRSRRVSFTASGALRLPCFALVGRCPTLIYVSDYLLAHSSHGPGYRWPTRFESNA